MPRQNLNILKLRGFLDQLHFPRTALLQTTQNTIVSRPESQIMPDHSKDKGRRGRGQLQSRETLISKAMSLLLRHAAEKEGLKMNDQGYANVADVV